MQNFHCEAQGKRAGKDWVHVFDILNDKPCSLTVKTKGPGRFKYTISKNTLIRYTINGLSGFSLRCFGGRGIFQM